DEAAGLFGAGVGLFTAGLIASRLLQRILHLLWWRGVVPLLLGVGVGLLAGGLATAVAPRLSDAPPFIAIGVGFLVTARMALRFAAPDPGSFWRLVLAVAQGFGIIMLAIGLTNIFFNRRNHEAPILMGIGS